MANRKIKALSSVDVYNLASTVRDEFEKVIETVGNEPVVLLVAKVVEILEHLERLTQVIHAERGELEDLKFSIEKLKSELVLSAAEKEKCQKEKQDMEEYWKKETKELTNYAAKVEEENLMLRTTIEKLKIQNTIQSEGKQELSQLNEEIHVLREKMYNQKDEVQLLKQSLSQKETEVEALQLQLDRFTQLNTDYRNRNSISTKQIQQLLEEKAELEVQLRIKSPETQVQMRERKSGRADGDDSDDLIKGVNRESCNFKEWEKLFNMEGKVIIDKNDPDRPRYSLGEMKKVMRERNDLKAQLYKAKEELSLYKTKPEGDVNDDDAVQGPINKEPEEKLHPERSPKPTGIQRLFQNFLRGSSSKAVNNNDRRMSSNEFATTWY